MMEIMYGSARTRSVAYARERTSPSQQWCNERENVTMKWVCKKYDLLLFLTFSNNACVDIDCLVP